MASVFISYSHTDRSLAERLAAALEAQGISVWMDNQITGGSTFTKVTEDELNRAGKVVVLWSRASIVSGWVCDEAQLGREQGKLFPLTIDGSQPPMGFRQIQTLDISAWAKGKQVEFPEGVLTGLGLEGEAEPGSSKQAPAVASGRRSSVFVALAAVVLLLGGAVAWLHHINPATSAPQSKSAEVMIVPFTAAGTNPDEAALASGITSELIVRLRRVPELRVMTALGVAETTNGSSSKAKNRVEGTVRLEGNRLRVSPTLTDAQGNVLWADNFNGELNDLLQVEKDIAGQVANSLSVSLDVGINSRSYGGTDNPEAYAENVQGLVAASRFQMDRAIDHFKHAVALDPDYGQALAGLTSTYGFALYQVSTKAEADNLLVKMDQSSARALKINADLYQSQSVRGWYEVARGDYVTAAKRVRHIEELDMDNDPNLKLELGRWASLYGRVKEAIEFEQPSELDDPHMNRGMFLAGDLVLAGRFEDAREQIRESADPNTAEGLGAVPSYWVDLLTGDAAKASELARKSKMGSLYENVPNFHFDADYMPNLPPDKLKQWADRKFGYGGKQQLEVRALFASHFGHPDLALEYLKLAMQRPGSGLPVLLWHPALAETRKTDGFAQLVTDLGLVKVWRESGDWGDYCQQDSAGKVSCV